jgi:uncharacterized protein YeaO (DUF488 family)
MIQLKRAYEKAGKDDGKRILVERLWPRGVTKAEAKIDIWEKEVAPSAELRKWYGHKPQRWEEFRKKYAAELKRNGAVERLVKLGRSGKVTFVYAARDEERNSAVVLKEFLQGNSGLRRD